MNSPEPKQTHVLELDRQVHAARFSPCGRYLAAGDFDGRVRRWDVTGDIPVEKPVLSGHGPWVEAVSFHPEGKFLYAGDSWGGLRAWPYDGENPEPLWTIEDAHDGWIRQADVSPDGALLATCGMDRTVRLWSTADGKKLHELTAHGEDVFCLRFHPDGLSKGRSLVSGDMKGVVKQWNAGDGTEIRTFDASVLYLYDRIQDVGGARCLAFDKDGTTLAVGGTQPKNGGTITGTPTVLLFDWQSGKLKHTLELGAAQDVNVFDMVFHPDGNSLAVVTSGTPGRGRFLFTRPGETEPFFLHTKIANCHALSLHPDGRRIAVTATNRQSNGNGRRVDKDGNYIANTSPIHFFNWNPEPGGG